MKSMSARSMVLALAMAVVASVSPAVASAQWFSPTSIWNTKLAANAELDARSTPWVTHLVDKVRTYGPWINTTQYSAPIYTVPSDQPNTKIWIDNYATPYQAPFQAVPIPASATPGAGTDHQMVISQPSTDTMWEFWNVYQAADGWHAGSGGKMANLSQQNGIFPNVQTQLFPSPYGATATGLPLLGGMITPSELAAGNIPHVVALAIPHPLMMWWFTGWAQRSDGDSQDNCDVPEGTRFRLPASLNIAKLNLPPAGATIARAVQKYGMVVRDRAGAVTFFGQDPKTMSSNPYPALFGYKGPDQVLANFPWASMQALKGQANVPLPAPNLGFC